MRVCAHVAYAAALQNQVRTTITEAREGTLAYQHRPSPQRNWCAYDAAKTQELPDTIALIQRFVDAATPPLTNHANPKGGRPRIAPSDLAKALLAQSYSKKSNRVAQGIAAAFGPRVGIQRHFSHKSIERAYDCPAVLAILQEVFRLTNVPVQGLETTFSIDGSGMVTCVRDNYQAARARQGKQDRGHGEWPATHAPRVYNVAVIGIRYKLLAAWRPTTDVHHKELAQLPAALAQAKANQPDMQVLLGDGLYAGRPQVQLVADHDVKPFFLPRRNVTLKRMGCDAWVTMLVAMAKNPQEWFADYHMRSISETGFSVINDGARIRKRLAARKQTESFLKAIVYNLVRLAQLRYLVTLEPLPAAC